MLVSYTNIWHGFGSVHVIFSLLHCWDIGLASARPCLSEILYVLERVKRLCGSS